MKPVLVWVLQEAGAKTVLDQQRFTGDTPVQVKGGAGADRESLQTRHAGRKRRKEGRSGRRSLRHSTALRTFGQVSWKSPVDR